MQVELICDLDCPNVEAAREQLSKALRQAGLARQWVEWDRQDLKSPRYEDDQ